MTASRHRLAEHFGHVANDMTDVAERYRFNRLCPYNGDLPSCTWQKAVSPLGICSMYHGGEPEIVCPKRFRQDWIVAVDAASFFFPPGTKWSSLTEVALSDPIGNSAETFDLVLVAYDGFGATLDFGVLEMQEAYHTLVSRDELLPKLPKAPICPVQDQFSESRKRLNQRLLTKGVVVHRLKKKLALAIDKRFFSALPNMAKVPKEGADLAWLIYELIPQKKGGHVFRYQQRKVREVYTRFEQVLSVLTQ
ncbi:MAG: hypothetical protein HUU46_14745 [Candidatus Hydrogenedentes bacterium]|nr:hypothetical protein [Candidatus Hydrogenedentota bacterium]